MRVLVTGGMGLLGVQLVRALARRGHEVVASDIASRNVDLLQGVWNDRVQFVQADVTDSARLQNVAREHDVKGIVHTAVIMNSMVSRKDPVRCFRVNVEGTLNVLEIARDRGIRCICMSSIAVYGPRTGLDTLAADDITPWPGTLYGAHKTMCETMIDSYRQSFGLDSAVFRPNQMYGPAPTQFRTVMDQILMRVMRGEPVVSESGGDCPIGWTYAPDMAEAIVRAMERPTLQNRIFNVDEGRTRTVRELGEIIGQLVPGAVIEIGPGLTMPGYNLPPIRGLGDSTAVREELQLKPTPLEEGVRVCVDWLRANPQALPVLA